MLRNLFHRKRKNTFISKMLKKSDDDLKQEIKDINTKISSNLVMLYGPDSNSQCEESLDWGPHADPGLIAKIIILYIKRKIIEQIIEGYLGDNFTFYIRLTDIQKRFNNLIISYNGNKPFNEIDPLDCEWLKVIISKDSDFIKITSGTNFELDFQEKSGKIVGLSVSIAA